MGNCRDFIKNTILECDWKDMGLLGACIGSLGALAGMVLPDKYKNAAAFTVGSTFFLSGVALAVRTVEACRQAEWDQYEDFTAWEEWDEEEYDDDDDETGFVMRITAEEKED